jgi:hypothetical protein
MSNSSPPARSLRASRARKAAPPRRLDPNVSPFSAFLERDKLRLQRARARRRTIIISLGVHALAVLAVVLYSFYQVDELFSPSVEVKVMSASKLPPGVIHPQPFVPPRPAPAAPKP